MQDLAKGGNKRANETLIRFLGDMKGTEATRKKGEISDLCAESLISERQRRMREEKTQ